MYTIKSILLSFIILLASTFAMGQQCEDFEDVGPQPFLPGFVLNSSPAGFYSNMTTLFVTADNCTVGGSKSVTLESGVMGSGGKSMIYHNPDGDGFPFKEGLTYEYSLSKILSDLNNVPFTEYENPTMTVALSNDFDCAAGECQVITPGGLPKSIAEIGDGECHPWPAMTFTPNQDYKYMLFSVDAIPLSPPNRLGVGIDDVCIQQVSTCTVNFQIEQNDSCSTITLQDISSGATNLFYTVTEPGLAPYQIPVISGNMQITLPSGTSTISITGTCNGGSVTAGPFSVTVTNSPPTYVACQQGDTVLLNPILSTCSVDYMIPNLLPSDPDSNIISNTCTIDGQTLTAGDFVVLTTGIYTVDCLVEDACGLTFPCTYYVEVACRIPGIGSCLPDIGTPLGTIPGPAPDPGLYTGAGSPVVLEQDCTDDGSDPKGVELQAGSPANTADVILIRPEAPEGTDPIFRMNQSYEYSLVKALSENSTAPILENENTTLYVALTNDLSCQSGDCQYLANKMIGLELAAGGCHPWDRMTFVPDADYQYMALWVETTTPSTGSDELLVVLDDICVASYDPCDDMSNLELGDLPDPPAVSEEGIYRGYGSPLVVEEDCTGGTDMKGVRIKAASPNSNGDGIVKVIASEGGSEPMYTMGSSYSFSLRKVLSAATDGDILTDYSDTRITVALTNDLAPCTTGSCQILASKDDSAALATGDCADWVTMDFVAEQDYQYMMIYAETTPLADIDELYIVIDDLCVQSLGGDGMCESTFDYIEEECGTICFTSTSTGATSWQYEFFGPGNVSPINGVADTCIQFPVAGTYQVQLSITCADGSFDRSPIDSVIVSAADVDPPVFDNCPISETLIATGPNCELEYVVPTITATDASAVTIDCEMDGAPITAGSVLILTPGSYNFTCIATDECGNDTPCEYIITVACEGGDDTDCTNFDDQSAGGWYRYNMIAKSSGSGYNISNRPVGLPATGPSGLPSDIYMKADDLPGSTWLINEVDYDGDWKEYIGQCFCFDYNVIQDGDSGGTPLTAAPYFLLTSAFDNTQPIMFGTNPVSAIRWQSNIPKTERDGWNNFCIGVDSCDALGNLPTVQDGTWSYVTGASSTCQDFNDILCNVESVMFGLDLTGSPTEEYGFDNICTGPCPPDPNDCLYSLAVDTLMTPDGECCYELDFDAQESWSYVTFNLQTPGVIFNTAMVNDTNTFRIDTLSSGTQLRVASKNPGWGGQPAGNFPNFMKFCFANVDSASQTPQCIVAEYFKPGPVDVPVLACRDTLKFNCPAPTGVVDTCLTITNMIAECDEEDPYRYKLTFTATNNSNFTASQVNLSSLDPNVKFLPIGAPASAVPQSTISVAVAGGLAPNDSTTQMVTLVLNAALSAPQSWCLSGHLYSQSMCCTSPAEFCTELDVCCDPCEEKGLEVTDISGIPVPQLFSYGASDDGDWLFVQQGGGPDVSGPTLSVISFDNTFISDGETSNSYLNFDFLEDLCEGAVVSSARLRLYADTNTGGHYASAVDNSCIAIQRIDAPWDEFTLVSTLPSVSSATTTFLDSPTFQYMNYDVDVTALVNDMISSGGYGFAIAAQCSDKNITLNFASKDHPNTALHPQLVLTINDQNCPEPSLEGECCHSVDITNECETEFFTQVELKSITPGVNIGSHATGGNAPQDWYVSNSTPNCVTWNHTSGYLPSGTTADLIQFCLDDIDPTEVPQQVVLHWYALDGNGEPYIACSDTMTFLCEPPVDNPCITVIDTELKGSPCDSIDCYETPFCLQWLRDTITGGVSALGSMPYDLVEKGYWNGQPVFLATVTLPPGSANFGGTDIFLCDGTLIQSCHTTIAGVSCMPNLNIDITTDITSKVQIWQAGDVLPPLDPDCASGSGGQNTIDVCLTFKNSSTHYADRFVIYPISAGVSYWPNPISLLPAGSNSCDTSTVAFQLYGTAITPGTTVKFAVRLADSQNPDDWCCFESDTVCILIPECPQGNPCDSVTVTQGPSIQEDSTCCTTITIDNNYYPNYFKGIKVTVAAPANISQLTALPGYFINHLDNYTAEVYPITGGNIPLGQQDILTLCTQDYSASLHVVTVTWLVQGPDGECIEECPTELTIECETDDELKCFEFVKDSINCETSTYCFQIKNTSNPSFDLYSVNLYDLTGGLVTSPSGRINIPSGPLASGQTSSWICVNYSGVSAGDTVCHKISAHNQPFGTPPSQCCTDTIEHCIIIPECPPMDECCESIDTFNNLVAQGFTVSSQGCTYTVCANQFDTCHWFSNLEPTWGDGGIIIPTTSPSNPPFNCWTHTYTTPGNYVITMQVWEGDEDQPCWNGTLTAELNCPEESLPCDSLLVTNAPAVLEDSLCCSTFTITNNDPINTYKGIVIDAGAGGTLSQVQGLNGYIITQLTPTRAVVSHPQNVIPQGTVDMFTLCTTGYTGPHTVTVSWLQVNDEGECIEVCPSEHPMECSIDDESKCFEFVQDSVHCESNTYCFQIKNTSNPSFDISSIILYGVTGGNLSPTTIAVPGGPLAAGATSDWICVSYGGANPGDNICYSIAAEDGQLGSPSTICCTDTLVQCFVVPDCPVDDCCDNIDEDEIADYYQNNTVVINGDCEGCFTVTPLDSCDILYVDFDQNGYVLIEDDTTCYAFTEAGTYPFTVKVERRDSDGELCFQDTFELQFEIEGCPPMDDCCDITQEDFDTKFATGINYNLTGCELCLPFALDSCEYLDVDYGDGTTISLQGGGVVPCYTYTGPSGSYTVTVDYYRLDANGDTCRQADAILDIVTSCPPVGGPCLTVIDGELDCELEAYCFRITNTSTFTMKSLAFIELTAGIALSPDPYQLLTPLAPGATSEEICLNYVGGFQGDTICFDVVGHQEDITIGEPPAFCCQDTVPVCFVVDCPVVPSTCVSVVQDSIDCESSTYCIRVQNNTFFDMNSIAFHNYSAGHSLSPDPVGIPTLTPGSTSDWICFTFSGAVLGDVVCYNIVGHEQDLSMGQEPIFCCSDTTQYCFAVDCEVDECCSISDDDLEQLLFDGLNVDIAQCALTLPFPEDSCAVLSIDFGDGNTWQSTGTDTIVHSYAADGVYILTASIQYFDADGELCRAIEGTTEITIDDCGNEPPCMIANLEIFNALSPNNDGLNDELIIDGSATCEKDIKVFNRWGQLVYSKKNYQNDWRGNSFSGELLAEGTYFLVVEIPDGNGNVLESTQTYVDIRK